jgi:hypothetical protein
MWITCSVLSTKIHFLVKSHPHGRVRTTFEKDQEENGQRCHAQLARCLVAPRNPAVVKHQPCIPCFGESLAHHGVREAPILAVPAPVPAALHAVARQSNRRDARTVVDFSTPFHAKEGRWWASPTEISHLYEVGKLINMVQYCEVCHSKCSVLLTWPWTHHEETPRMGSSPMPLSSPSAPGVATAITLPTATATTQ